VTEPAWVEHAVWWHVYPLGFVAAEAAALDRTTPAIHRLPNIALWLDYLVDLGASGLLLGPVFESSTHGYDTVDYFRIDRRLGDDDDFAALVEQAHERGVRVLLDGVFNHVGRDFPMFARALGDGPGSSADGWFRIFWPEAGDAEPDYEHFEGHRQLVTLNHESPDVVDFVVDVMTYWLDRGADGWRLDAAYAVAAGFWAQVLPRVRERHPEAYFVGEVIHGDYAVYVAEATLDSVTQYELWKAIWSSLNDRNLYELDWTLTRHNELLDHFAPLTFLGNHDVTRIASRLQDDRHLPHAVVLLMTLGGTPCIYSGDEQGFRGMKEDREGGDAAVRPAFPAEPDGLSPLGRPTLALHQELVGLRRRHPWLHRARSHVKHLANGQLVYSSQANDDAIIVALNLDEDAVTLPAAGGVSVLAGAGDVAGSGGQTTITLAAHGWAVLSAESK